MTVARPWSSVGLASGYRGNPWVSTARATPFYCTWRSHGRCHGCGHGTCRGSVRGNLRGTNHGNPREYHGSCHGIFHAHLRVNCRGNQRQPKANATAFHDIPRQTSHSKCHGNTRQLPRNSTAVATELPRTPNHRNFHGIPWHSAAFRGIARQFHGYPPMSGNCHRTPRQLPRNSMVIATAISTENNGIPRASAANATAILQYAAIATGLHGNCHGKFTDVKPL